MTHEYFIWIATLAYGFHIIEELALDWRGWARGFMKMPAEWNEFYVVNAVVVLFGAACAMVGWKCPMFSLAFPALMLINTLFHSLPTIKSHRFSPGLFTAIILFVPIAALTYYGASMDHVLSANVIIFSALFGLIFMAYPIIIQKIKTKPFFKQSC